MVRVRIASAAAAIAASITLPAVAMSGAPTTRAVGLDLAPAIEAPASAIRVHEAVAGSDLESMARGYLARHAAAYARSAAGEGDLALKAIRHGKAVDVVRFRQMSGGVPVYRGEIAVSFNRKGEAIYVASDLRPLSGDLAGLTREPEMAAGAARAAAIALLDVSGPLNLDRQSLVVFPGADRARLAWFVQLVPSVAPSGDWHLLYDAATGELLRVENMAYEANGTGTAFMPDPLSSAHVAYGTTGYSDPGGSDADTPELIAEIETVQLLDITFDGSIYTLAGPWADCREIEAPTVACPTDPDGDFSVLSRSNDSFEPQLDYYHLDRFMRYINVDLGIAVTPYQYVGGVRYDSHGLNNADNSHYVSGTGILAFGDGGVDDSEDPDVVIHELGHGLHDWLTSGGLSQTQGLSEGLGDYFGISYSRRFPGQWTPADAQYNWMFSWDGHNPFWSGRLTNWNDTHRYPSGLTGTIHTDGQFWASCNIDVAELIGYDEADAAVIEGISMTGGSTNQAQAAQAVVNAAEALAYPTSTIATIVSTYNYDGTTKGCNYGVTTTLGLFRDGFASGGTGAWSFTAP